MLESNIWKFTIFNITNKRIFVAILSVYYMTIPDITIQNVGVILLLGNLAGFLFEIPSGYLSDKIGHKRTLVLSRIFMILSTSCFLMGTNLYFLSFGSILLSLAFAFTSGTASAFMHETLITLKRENDYGKVMGKIKSIGFAVPIILTILVPLLVNISYRLPFLIALFIDFIGLITAISFVSPKIKAEKIKEISATNFKQVIQKGKESGFLKWAIFFAFISGVGYALSAFRGPYQELLEIPVIYFGILLGVGRGIASLLLFFSGRFQRYFSLKSLVTFKFITYIILVGVLGFFSNLYFVATIFILLNSLEWGVSQIENTLLLQKIGKSRFKATLLSVRGQMMQIVSAFFAGGIGVLIHKTSYQTGFIVLAFVILSVYIVLIATLKKR
ncbi:MAG: MFS transporter [Alphaproteobacteria bacterium]